MMNRSPRQLDYIHCRTAGSPTLLQPYRFPGYCFYRRKLTLEQSFSKRQFQLRLVTRWRPCQKGWRRPSTEPSQLPCSLLPAGPYRWGKPAGSAGSRSSVSANVLRWDSWAALRDWNRGHSLITRTLYSLHKMFSTKCFYHAMFSLKLLKIWSKIQRKPQMELLRQGAVLSSFSNGSITCFLIIITSLANILNKQKYSVGYREIWASLRLDLGTSVSFSNRPCRL